MNLHQLLSTGQEMDMPDYLLLRVVADLAEEQGDDPVAWGLRLLEKDHLRPVLHAGSRYVWLGGAQASPNQLNMGAWCLLLFSPRISPSFAGVVLDGAQACFWAWLWERREAPPQGLPRHVLLAIAKAAPFMPAGPQHEGPFGWRLGTVPPRLHAVLERDRDGPYYTDKKTAMAALCRAIYQLEKECSSSKSCDEAACIS